MFPTFAPLPYGPKITRLNRIHISTRMYSLLGGNFSPRRRNNLVHILLDTMNYSPLLFTMLTNSLSSNTGPHMMVPFLLVPPYCQEKFQEREMKRGQTSTKTFQAKRKTWNCTLPQISSNINFLSSTRVVDHDYKSSKNSTIWYKFNRNSTQELMEHTPRTFQAIHLYLKKSDKSSIWIL